jgi:zona occludens toxin
VVDEVQRVWRPRASGARVPDSVAALETHRHRGIDIFVTTQAPRLMDSNVRGLVGRHVHIRDVGILGRYWYEWPECNDSMLWKACVNKKRISLPKKAFDLYKSASIHTTPVRGVPRALIFGVIALILFALLAFGVYRIYAKTQAPPASSSSLSPSKTTSIHDKIPSSDVNGIHSAGYDTTQFIPRVSNVPESAPAFDHLRLVVAMPMMSGGICMDKKCKCFTTQGTDSGLSSEDCRTWMQNRPFNPYLQPEPLTVAKASPNAPPVPPPPPPQPIEDLSAGFSAVPPEIKTRLY